MGCRDCFYDDSPCVGGCTLDDDDQMTAEDMILAIEAAAFDSWIERMEVRA